MRFRNFEEVSFSLYFALKYNFCINAIDINELLKTNSCIVLIFSFLYFTHIGDNDACGKLRTYAIQLSLNEDDFGQNWIFIYELLAEDNLRNEWEDMKAKQITFLKPIDQW